MKDKFLKVLGFLAENFSAFFLGVIVGWILCANTAQAKPIDLHKLSKIPKLICWGEHDFAFPLVFLAEWKRRFPDAEVHQFPDAGHYILEDIPQKVIPLTKNFLKNHPL